MFKIGDRVEVVGGFNVGASGVIVPRPSGLHSWPNYVLRDDTEHPAGYSNRELKLILRNPLKIEEEKMFETGKTYKSRDLGNIIEVLHHTEKSAHIRIVKSHGIAGEGSEHCYPQTAFAGGSWEEYVEPKVDTRVRFILHPR
jgi:hypothetical protein